MGTSAEDVIDLIIEYVGLSSAPQTLSLETVLLSGGKTGTSPTGAVTTPRPYSANPLYSPLPY